jgi:16S rRNA (uracil1498-N3)-methyltransferase
MSYARLYVEDPLSAGGEVVLSKEQSHYLGSVMRVKDGESLLLFNGEDGEWRATVEMASKKKLVAHVQEQTKQQTYCPDIWLAFAPIKHGRIDFLAQKATELGVAGLLPVRTSRTIVSRVNEERLLANAIEAAEQSERLDVPRVAEYQTLQELISRWDNTRVLIYGDETLQAESANKVLARLRPQKEIGVLIGPEGGFTEDELAMLRALPYSHGITLGSRILRADTAALAALTAIQLTLGDWA